MEAPKGRGGITPLPPPEPDGTGRELARAPRPWLAALLAVGGLLVFALWLAESGTVPAPDAAASESTVATLAPLSARDLPSTTVPLPPTTTAPTPPRLGEALPWLQGGLIMFSHTGDTDSMIFWVDSERSPQEFSLSGSNVAKLRPEPDSLSNIAYETPGTANALYLGGWQVQEPIFVGSQGFAWDPGGSGTLMWVGTDQVTQTTALYSKGLGDPIVRLVDVPSSSSLLEWTTHGLVMSEAMGSPVTIVDEAGNVMATAPILTVLRDTDGSVLATAAAEPLKAAGNGTIVATGTALAFEAAGIEIAADLVPPNELVILDTSLSSDGATGFEVRQIPLREALADGESIFSADGRWSLSPNGDWAGRIVNWSTSTSLVVQSLETLSVRVVPIRTEAPLTTVGFSADGQRFFGFSSESGEFVAIDWLTGAQFVVPIDGNIRLGGAFVRQ